MLGRRTNSPLPNQLRVSSSLYHLPKFLLIIPAFRRAKEAYFPQFRVSNNNLIDISFNTLPNFTRGKITDVDYKNFIQYAAKFYSNSGNYSSFGNTKFIPEIECEKFEEILKCSSNWNDISYIWGCIKEIVYDNSTNFKTINLNERHGKNSYYLGDIKEESIVTIDKFLASKGIEPLNTRLMMINPTKFCYMVASVDERVEEWDANIIGYYGKN